MVPQNVKPAPDRLGGFEELDGDDVGRFRERIRNVRNTTHRYDEALVPDLPRVIEDDDVPRFVQARHRAPHELRADRSAERRTVEAHLRRLTLTARDFVYERDVLVRVPRIDHRHLAGREPAIAADAPIKELQSSEGAPHEHRPRPRRSHANIISAKSRIVYGTSSPLERR